MENKYPSRIKILEAIFTDLVKKPVHFTDDNQEEFKIILTSYMNANFSTSSIKPRNRNTNNPIR
jgi:hypothetical protein